VDKFKASFLLGLLCLVIGSNTNAAVKDPTKPMFKTKQQGQSKNSTIIRKQQLTAIFIKKDKKQAIINDKLYRVGDYVGDKKLVAIDQSSVLLKSSSGVNRLVLVTSFKKLKKK
jgi:hypothetical protein